VIAEQLSRVEEMPPRDPIYGNHTYALHPLIAKRLKELGIESLYSHQAQSFDSWSEGKNVLVTTGTNSGKTLCYNLPALQTCLTEPAARCLYLFPTKALAQDQLSKLNDLAPSSIRSSTYDGDTAKSSRSTIRKSAHIVLTNPDMLHLGILPQHESWSSFLRSLRLLVLDELHVYRGVFGSHVANVLRRLLRLCDWYGARPQIIACSATIGNPQELFEKLTGRTAAGITEDGSPSGGRTFIFWNPPELSPGRRASANFVSAQILSNFAAVEKRTLVFSRSRNSAELVLRYARKRASDLDEFPPEALESYRAGYTVKERREIERSLFTGKLLGLSATNAMELGVDVGSLDAVVMNGYPGTASSFWQQAGRAGRGTKSGIAIMVAHDDPLEQFLVRQPDLLLEAGHESVALNPQNPTILAKHLLCAAHERPIAPSELEEFGPASVSTAESLDRSGELVFQAGLFYYPQIGSPAADVNLRGSSGDSIRILVDGQELGAMERWRAMTSAHKGAVYLHRGSTYLVQDLDLDQAIAYATQEKVDFYTQAVSHSVIDPRVPVRETTLGQAVASLCAVSVTDQVQEFRRKSLDGDTVLSIEPLDLPPTTFDTVGVRFDLPPLIGGDDYLDAIGGVHGLEHALLAVAPLLAGCDRSDVGSAWYSVFPDTLRPAIFVFDRTPGGVGLCEKLFDSLGGWLKASLQLLASCSCQDGCPSCLLSPRCESSNETLNKKNAMALLRALVG
jgi:DEAD/DEAH box helicase domain-containing protein